MIDESGETCVESRICIGIDGYLIDYTSCFFFSSIFFSSSFLRLARILRCFVRSSSGISSISANLSSSRSFAIQRYRTKKYGTSNPSKWRFPIMEAESVMIMKANIILRTASQVGKTRSIPFATQRRAQYTASFIAHLKNFALSHARCLIESTTQRKKSMR